MTSSSLVIVRDNSQKSFQHLTLRNTTLYQIFITHDAQRYIFTASRLLHALDDRMVCAITCEKVKTVKKHRVCLVFQKRQTMFSRMNRVICDSQDNCVQLAQVCGLNNFLGCYLPLSILSLTKISLKKVSLQHIDSIYKQILYT